jgi:hypothetical protein
MYRTFLLLLAGVASMTSASAADAPIAALTAEASDHHIVIVLNKTQKPALEIFCPGAPQLYQAIMNSDEVSQALMTHGASATAVDLQEYKEYCHLTPVGP